jgi:hypothetical protein
MSWQADLEEAQRRLAALDAERDLASARAAAPGTRFVTHFSEFFDS